MQGAKELAFDAASTFELPELDKVTIFAPDDAALMSAPTTNATAEVSILQLTLVNADLDNPHLSLIRTFLREVERHIYRTNRIV